MPLLITLLAIIFLVLLISYFRIHVFIAFLVVSLFAGFSLGIPVVKIVGSIQKGMGDTLSSIVYIIALGAMLGKLVAQSGAVDQISQTLIKLFGQKYLRWAFLFIGFLVGLPLFYSVGFMLLAPIAITVATRYKIPAIYIGFPLITSLSVTQGFLPPHPAPLLLVQQLHANMGKTLFLGIIISIPAILLGGMLFGKTVKNILRVPNSAFVAKELAPEEMPSKTISFLSVLLPVILIAINGDPIISMLISVVFAIYFLGIRRQVGISEITSQLTDSIKEVAMLFLIFGGAGSLKQILVEGGVSAEIAQMMSHSSLHPFILGWLMAAFIRVSVGSSTVAGITTAGFFVPVVQATGVDPNLMVLSIGSGSMMFAHVNDTGFWLFKEYFQLSIKEIIRSYSIMETIISISGLLGVLCLNYFMY
ncbi:gluconate transporter [Sandaracinomonas limnophila]|uniref:Gluconate transporter n=1 Tax=Sandaracinomonas limnophila TaxID=1862386 RepID=A0A437PMT4_9BACT|nr:SLC13 family permease [Sandaracinomonas limnophila]RVU23608.1 gluconate transporter [Sandaracinomonas limnophila]